MLDDDDCGYSAAIALARNDPTYLAIPEPDPRWTRPLLGVVWGLIAPVAVPDRLRQLDAAEAHHRYYAEEALRRFGPLARAAVPTLLRRMKDERLLPEAARVLAWIEPTHPAVVPALTASLASGDTEARYAAVELARLGPAAAMAIPRLERILLRERYQREVFESALARVRSEPRELEPGVVQRIGTLARESRLLDRERDRERILACVEALAERGEDARPALPLLLYFALDDRLRDYRHRIEAAAARIDGRRF